MRIFYLSLAGVLFVLLSVCLQALAYDDQTTHPALTDKIVDFYNLSYSDTKITPEQKEWIVQGSIAEDTAPRWINHFYDPIHKTGWTGAKAGFVPQPVVQALSYIGLSPESAMSSVEWVNAYITQESYSRYGGNRTWQRALEYYADGNLEEAYKTLGHVLHLLEDASVPDHTRDDTHAHGLQDVTGDYGSPYEEYAKKWTRTNLDITNSLKQTGAGPIEKGTVTDYLISLAEYSSKYFFSKDTINDPKYELPKIIREDDNFGYGSDENENNFPLVRIKKVEVNKFDFSKQYLIEVTDKSVLDAYFSRLSRQAVLHGAGLIHLFQKKAADAVVNKEFPVHLYKVDISLVTPPIFSLTGEAARVSAVFQSLMASVGNAWQNLFSASSNNQPSLAHSSNDKNPPIPADIFSSPTSSLDTATERIKSSSSLQKIVKPTSSPPRSNPDASSRPSSSPQVTTDSAANSLAFQPVFIPPIVNPPALPAAPIYSGPAGGVAIVSSDRSSGDAPSTPVPSESPPIPAREPTSSAPTYNFRAVYDSERHISFSWDPPAGGGASSSIYSYSIYNITGSSSGSLILSTTSSSAEIGTREIGRSYLFELLVQTSSTAIGSSTAAVDIPSFLDRFYFYRDPRPGATTYLFDLTTTSSRPFWGGPDPGGQNFKAIAFYLNKDAPAQEIITSGNDLVLNDPASIGLQYPPCAYGGPIDSPAKELVIPQNDRSCGSGPMASRAFQRWLLEDRRLTIKTVSSTTDINFNPSDYVTLAFYDFGGGGGGEQRLALAALDKTKYYFQTSRPAQDSPTAPADLSVNFDPLHLILNVSWPASTDSDTLDYLIIYEFNYSTSSELRADSWQSVGDRRSATVPLVFPNQYLLGVRAVDDFGNVSLPASATWNFPAGFPLLPFQLNHDSKIDTASSGHGQRIFINATATIDGVAMQPENFGGPFCCSQTYLEIYSDRDGGLGELLSTSPPVGTAGESVYNIPPLELQATMFYWLVPRDVLGRFNPNFILGSRGNPYPDGFWSSGFYSDGSADAYFRLRPVTSVP